MGEERQLTNEELAEQLLTMAALRSLFHVLGWAHPDCVILEEAARRLRGDSPQAQDDRPTDVPAEQDR